MAIEDVKKLEAKRDRLKAAHARRKRAEKATEDERLIELRGQQAVLRAEFYERERRRKEKTA